MRKQESPCKIYTNFLLAGYFLNSIITVNTIIAIPIALTLKNENNIVHAIKIPAAINAFFIKSPPIIGRDTIVKI